MVHSYDNQVKKHPNLCHLDLSAQNKYCEKIKQNKNSKSQHTINIRTSNRDIISFGSYCAFVSVIAFPKRLLRL